MSRLQQLPSDQSAVLSLLLRQRKTYAQVAGMLRIRESAVRDRAHEAIAALGAEETTSLLRTHRQEIGDYLLGQCESLSHGTRTYLRTLPGGRTWANEVRAQLQEISPQTLPQIPSDEPAPRAGPEHAATRVAQEPQAASREIIEPREDTVAAFSEGSRGQQVSRRGGALLLAGILAVIVVAVIVIADGGGGHGSSSSAASTGKSASTTAANTSGTASTSSAGVHIDAQLSLAATQPGSAAKGAAEIASDGSKHAFDIIAEGLPPSTGFFYVAWLYNSPSHAVALGRAPAVGTDGKLQAAGALPANAGEYHEMILTEETDEHTVRPGQIVLKGTFDLQSSASSGTAGSSGAASPGEAAAGSGEAASQGGG
jgi:hypothetical protein